MKAQRLLIMFRALGNAGVVFFSTGFRFLFIWPLLFRKQLFGISVCMRTWNRERKVIKGGKKGILMGEHINS